MIGLICLMEFMFNETNGSLECIIYHYWYFLKVNFRIQPNVWENVKNIKGEYKEYINKLKNVRRKYGRIDIEICLKKISKN